MPNKLAQRRMCIRGSTLIGKIHFSLSFFVIDDVLTSPPFANVYHAFILFANRRKGAFIHDDQRMVSATSIPL